MRPGEGGTRWVTTSGSAQGSCLLCGVTLPVHAPTLLQGLPRPGNVPVPTGSPWHSINPLLRLHCNAWVSKKQLVPLATASKTQMSKNSKAINTCFYCTFAAEVCVCAR